MDGKFWRLVHYFQAGSPQGCFGKDRSAYFRSGGGTGLSLVPGIHVGPMCRSLHARAGQNAINRFKSRPVFTWMPKACGRSSPNLFQGDLT